MRLLRRPCESEERIERLSEARRLALDAVYARSEFVALILRDGIKVLGDEFGVQEDRVKRRADFVR